MINFLLALLVVIILTQYIVLTMLVIIDESPLKNRKVFWLWVFPAGILWLAVLYLYNLYQELN